MNSCKGRSLLVRAAVTDTKVGRIDGGCLVHFGETSAVLNLMKNFAIQQISRHVARGNAEARVENVI